jgi:hypothetical protein
MDSTSKYISFVLTPSNRRNQVATQIVVTIFVHAEKIKPKAKKNKAGYFFKTDEFME